MTVKIVGILHTGTVSKFDSVKRCGRLILDEGNKIKEIYFNYDDEKNMIHSGDNLVWYTMPEGQEQPDPRPDDVVFFELCPAGLPGFEGINIASPWTTKAIHELAMNATKQKEIPQ